ncbi:MAG: CinA family protein [bacterium]
MFDSVHESVRELHNHLRANNAMLSTAESCTGGLLGAAITSVSGSSDVYEGGGVTYSNKLKQKVLGVDVSVLEDHGAVSEPVARAMASGASEVFDTLYSVGITGIAGPKGGTSEKPVGLVHFGFQLGHQLRHERKVLDGSRSEVRFRSVKYAINTVIEALRKPSV